MKLEVNCASLPAIQAAIELGKVELDPDNKPNAAKLLVLNSLIGGQDVEVVLGGGEPSFSVPETDDPRHQGYIVEARLEAENSPCWVSKVGTVVFDDEGGVIARGHNQPVLKGDFCTKLSVTSQEAMKILKAGERLDFCQAAHDVAVVVANASREQGGLKNRIWALTLEPCDNCANLLVLQEPKAVYYSLGVGRKRYYNSKGLGRLVEAEIPTYFVKMEDK